MRIAALALIIGNLLVVAARSEEPAGAVFCPAVDLENSQRYGYGAKYSALLPLIVVGRLRPLNWAWQEGSSDPSYPSATEDRIAEVVVERQLFGSPCGATLRVAYRSSRELPTSGEGPAQILALYHSSDLLESDFSLGGYADGNRLLPLSELANEEALARARLDQLVLSSTSIFVGRPTGQSAEDGSPYVAVERVVHGTLTPGRSYPVSHAAQNRIPLPQEGPYLYFISAT